MQAWQESAVLATAQAETVAEATLRALAAAGQRGATHDATGRMLLAYWGWLRAADLAARRELVDGLRELVAAGRTSPRAWLPVALGETDFTLARTATRACLGACPVSVERRERATGDAHDWVRRRLALNPAAVFAALVDAADETTVHALRGLRSALGREEALTVIDSCNPAREPAVAQFLEEWRARCA